MFPGLVKKEREEEAELKETLKELENVAKVSINDILFLNRMNMKKNPFSGNWNSWRVQWWSRYQDYSEDG